MRLRGRLGNQLFIYAFGRALQEELGMPLVLIDNRNETGGTKLNELSIPDDVKIVTYSAGYNYDYYNMRAEDYKRINSSLIGTMIREHAYNNCCKKNKIPTLSIDQKTALYWHKLMTRKNDFNERVLKEKKHSEYYTNKGLYICENGYIDFGKPSDKVKNVFGFGYFQSEKYFLTIKDKIRKEVRRKEELNPKLKDYINHIERTDSVCLSIRMGDYINNSMLGVCTKDYYDKAIKKIYEMCPNAYIFLYSDDIQAAMDTFKFHGNVIVEPEGCSETEKLEYMSKCKHFIISNSSFSWWVQYLGEFEGKIVIAPEKWTQIPCPCDIYQDEWLIIDT